MFSKPAVSVVIPNYNGEKLLAKNLPLLLDVLSIHGKDCEVIVVDDGSTDGSRGLIGKFPVRGIFLERNRGFPGACNEGFKRARGEFILLLNSDVEVYTDIVSELLSSFPEDALSVGPRVLGRPDGDSWYGFYMVYFKRGKIRFRAPKPLRRDLEKLSILKGPVPTAFNIGCAVMFHRERLLFLGGFDEIFSPYYCEDWDVGLRAWRRGFKCYVLPSSWVVHPGGKTIRRTQTRDKRLSISFRNKLIFNTKHITDGRLLSFAVHWLVLRPFVRKSTAYLRGLLMYLSCLDLALERRRVEMAEEVKALDAVSQEILSSLNMSLTTCS